MADESACFLFGLLAASCVAMGRAHEGSLRVIVVLLANWLGVMIGTTFTGRADPWGLFMALDGACAVAILWHPATRLHAVIGAIYVGQLLMHMGYALALPRDTAFYLNVLAGGGWLQIAMLAGGGFYEPGRGLRAGRAVRLAGALAGRALRESVEARR